MAWSTPIIHATGDIVSASDWNIDSNDLSFLYGDTGWTALAPLYTNSWVDFATANLLGGFRLVGTRVVLRGTMKSGTINTTAFTLPVGYRPTGTAVFACASNGAFGYLIIASSGTVNPAVGSNAWFALDGITFDTI